MPLGGGLLVPTLLGVPADDSLTLRLPPPPPKHHMDLGVWSRPRRTPSDPEMTVVPTAELLDLLSNASLASISDAAMRISEGASVEDRGVRSKPSERRSGEMADEIELTLGIRSCLGGDRRSNQFRPRQTEFTFGSVKGTTYFIKAANLQDAKYKYITVRYLRT
uniref:Uncharacterized protein n=1 Tax=Oryza brachyantha TaxID=4533 RepID=J3M5M3_ORYBR